MIAGAWSALAAIVSFGAIAFTSPDTRIGVISTDASRLLLSLLAGAAVLAVGWGTREGARTLAATAPLVFVFLPWLPLPVPPVFLVWTGALASVPWIGVGIALLCVINRARRIMRDTLERRRPLLAGLFSFVIFSLAAWAASPSLPGGDEPHYLVITQSLLRDRDIRIENNHQRGDYRAYFAGDLAPDSVRRGRNGEIYSIHAPGLPALVLPAFAMGGYRGVVVFLILLSSAGCALAWWLAWRSTKSAAAAWFGWASVTLAAPFLLESFTVFPDGPGAVVVLTGFWALLRAEQEGHERDEGHEGWLLPWVLHGGALALLPWMHTRFAVLAGTLGGLVLVRLARAPNPLGKAVAFLFAPAISALGWLFFFTIIYGAPDPSAPYGREAQNTLAFFPDGLGGLLFDQGFGLLATAPVLLAALAGLARVRRLAIDYIVVALPYLLAVATYAMWWAGMSGPARFLVPLVLPLAIPAAYAWAGATRPLRALMLAALVISAWLSLIMAGAGGGRLGYHTRNDNGMTAAPWLEWANHVVDLPSAFPAFVPQPVQPDPGGLVSRANAARTGFAATVPWILCFALAAGYVTWRARDRPQNFDDRLVSEATLAFAIATTMAIGIVWKMHGAVPITATNAQLDVLRRLARGRVMAVGLSPARQLSREDAWAMRMELPIRRGRGARPNAAIAAFPAVPAGSYALSVRRRGGEGWVMIGVGNDQFAIVTQPIASYDAGIRIDLPVDVRALLVRSDEAARAQLESVELRPVARTERLSPQYARRAVRYDSSVIYFLDDRSFPEPTGFWVAGSRATQLAIRPDSARSIAALLLRNGAADNTVELESRGWRESLSLKAGEERRVDVPIDPAIGAALLKISSASGFRPSEVNSGSRDTRFLGVFVRTAEP